MCSPPRAFLLPIILIGIIVASPSLALNIQDSDITADNIVKLGNQNRVAFGLANLKRNTVLEQAASLKAKDMAEKGYFSHVSSDGRNPWYWMDKVGYSFSYAGENLAVNFSSSQEIVKAWMASPGHKENLLNNNFAETGIGVYQGKFQGKDAVYVVQLLAKPFPTGGKSNILIKSKNKLPERVCKWKKNLSPQLCSKN